MPQVEHKRVVWSIKYWTNLQNNDDPEDDGDDGEGGDDGGEEGGDDDDEEEDEEDPVDPLDEIKENCADQASCAKLKMEFESCNDRVNSRSQTEETCVQELFDFLHCQDNCVSWVIFWFYLYDRHFLGALYPCLDAVQAIRNWTMRRSDCCIHGHV